MFNNKVIYLDTFSEFMYNRNEKMKLKKKIFSNEAICWVAASVRNSKLFPIGPKDPQQ
jgi:hypothetical protein